MAPTPTSVIAVTSAGGTINAAAALTGTLAVTLAAGDTVVLATNVGGTGMNVTGPGGQPWQRVAVLEIDVTEACLWIVPRAVAASGNITITRPAGSTGNWIGVVQVYSGVGEVIPVPPPTERDIVNPAVAPASGQYFDVTVPGSWGVAGFQVSGSGSTNALAFTNPRRQITLPGQGLSLKDAAFPTPGPNQVLQYWSVNNSQPTWVAAWAPLSVLLVPYYEEPGPPLPTVSLNASPLTINLGQSSTLTWSTTDATSASISGIGTVALSGSQSVTPSVTTTYTLTATGLGGTETASVTVTVVQPTPTATLNANPQTIQSGQSSTLTWNSTNATSVTISGLGTVATSGSQSVSPSVTTTYNLTATGPGGTGYASATVTVSAAPPAVQVNVTPAGVSLTAGDSQQFQATVTGSADTRVTWTASPGTISPTGLYTAPPVFVPTVGTVRATSMADLTQSATAALNILPTELILPPAFGGGGFRRFVRKKKRGSVWTDEQWEGED